MDIILALFDDYVLDSAYAFLLPASPSPTSLLAHSPYLLKHFLQDAQTQQRLAVSSSATAAAASRVAATAAGAAGAGAGWSSGLWWNNLTGSSAASSVGAAAAKATSSLIGSSRKSVSALLSHSAAAASSSAAVAQAAGRIGANAAGAVGERATAAALDALDWQSLQGLSALTRDNMFRQSLSLYLITYLGILVLYFLFAGLSYKYIFNKAMLQHPRFLKNQVSLEIACSLAAFPVLDLLTLPWFVGEVRGHSRLYTSISDGPFAHTSLGLGGWTYAILSVPFFLLFTDFCIYWVHRLEHHPRLYKHVHKPHHKWLVPTPFASHAFHPLDGYAQSLPYHIFVFLFPLHRLVYIGLFVFVNLWSILIHDSDMICNSPLEAIINGPSHHTLHHLYFTVNYGQYFTGCDRLGGSYRAPKAQDDPLNDVKALQAHDKQLATGGGGGGGPARESKKAQ